MMTLPWLAFLRENHTPDQPKGAFYCAYLARYTDGESDGMPDLLRILGKFGFARRTALTILAREISA
jgi:hypothetical protein